MPAIAAAIGAILIRIAGDILIQGLIAVGIGIATFTGVDVTLTWLKGQAVSSIMALDPTVVSLLAYMKVGVAMNILFSALVIRLSLAGMKSGTMKKWAHK